MRLVKRFAQGELRLNRIEAFSDAVFAIIVTLLVLELRVPVLHDRGSASEQLREQLPKFLSWLISFPIVCKFWLNHHHLLTFARHATYGMIGLNSIFLMGQAFEHPPLHPLQSYIMRNLIKPEMACAIVPHLLRKSFRRRTLLFARRGSDFL